MSSDKSFVVHDSESLEVVKKVDGAHGKGIMDFAWLDDNTLATCSTDNLVKYWRVDEGAELR